MPGATVPCATANRANRKRDLSFMAGFLLGSDEANLNSPAVWLVFIQDHDAAGTNSQYSLRLNPLYSNLHPDSSKPNIRLDFPRRRAQGVVPGGGCEPISYTEKTRL